MVTDPQASCKPPIFVVGVPRSGTTLLSAMLSSHSRLSCGPETSFFAALDKCSDQEILRARDWPDAAVDFLYSIRLGGEPVPERFGLDRQRLASYMAVRPREIPTVLESLTDQFRIDQGKERWIEKSPIHLLHATSIRRHYPTARIVRIVRDGRDVALSLLNVPWGPDSFESALLYWRRFESSSSRFFASSGNDTCSVRYEDLIRDPESQLHAICDYLDETFEPSMLDYAGQSESLRKSNETWKGKVGTSLDSSRIEVWRRTLSTAQQSTAIALTGDRLGMHGYPAAVEDGRAEPFVWLQPMTEDVAGYEPVLQEILRGGARCWRRTWFELPRLIALFGRPEENGWLGRGTMERFRRILGIVLTLLSSRLAGRRIIWRVQKGSTPAAGYCERLFGASTVFLGIKPQVGTTAEESE